MYIHVGTDYMSYVHVEFLSPTCAFSVEQSIRHSSTHVSEFHGFRKLLLIPVVSKRAPPAPFSDGSIATLPAFDLFLNDSLIL